MLKKIQVTPGFVHGVVGLYAFPAAAMAGEFTASAEVDVDVQAFLFRVEVGSFYQPRRNNAQGHLQ